MIFLGIIAFAFYSLVMDNRVEDNLLFITNIILASLSFASALTMISAIAAKAGNNATLMAILGFPVILPLLLLIIKISKAAMDGLDRSLSIDEIAIVLSINVIIITVTYLLFPYLWRS
jgi:heme exporter protein B